MSNKAEILIIDDEVQIRKLLEITLESNDYAVRFAAAAPIRRAPCGDGICRRCATTPFRHRAEPRSRES